MRRRLRLCLRRRQLLPGYAAYVRQGGRFPERGLRVRDGLRGWLELRLEPGRHGGVGLGAVFRVGEAVISACDDDHFGVDAGGA